MHRRRRITLGSTLLVLAGGLALAAPQAPAPQKLSPEQTELFEKKVRPTLVESCLGCHSKDNMQGGLRLDAPITAAQAADVMKRVRGEGGKPLMPQGGPALPAEKIAALDAWVKSGAGYPQTPIVGQKSALWSLQPVKAPVVPGVKLVGWVKSPIDAFILARLEPKGLSPAPEADKRTLLRRLSYDLTGLPPTPTETQSFLADKSPGAYEKVVDRLLASPRYGERQARLWLDLARYADTKGYVFNEDRAYPNAYTYRDWVIEAFNKDLPYDRFVTEQLAADRLPVDEDNRKQLAALGFLTVGRRFLNNQADIIDDRIDVAMRGFQGLTVSCARCHDHKFDPVPTQDYYSLYSVFASSNENAPVISPKAIREPWEQHDAQFNGVKNEWERLVRENTATLRERVKKATVGDTLPDDVKKALQSVRENELPDGDNLKKIVGAFSVDTRARLDSLMADREKLRNSYPTKPEIAMGLTDGSPVTVGVFKRGNQANQGEPAPRRFLKCVSGDERPEWKDGSGRLELAKSIISPKNPLTARVMANRIWLSHFGNGIVRTPSDFGKQGEKPTHPELLDWLATVFVKDGWSMKKLHKRIVLSSAYRMVADASPKSFNADPENRLLTRQSRKRLDLEQLRDSLLLASGKLDVSTVGGPSVDLWKSPAAPRRAVYGYVERQNLPGIFKTFDFATPDAHSPQRFKTVVPQQALFLLNAPLVAEQARALGALAKNQKLGSDDARARWLYLRLFSRLPAPDEAALAQKFLASPDGPALGAQSESSWSYGWGKLDDKTGIVTEFTPFPAFVDGMWRGSEKLPDPTIGWAMLTAGGGHPGNREHMTIRRWTAPADLTLKISGTLKHPGDVGDGVRARIVHSRTGVVGDWSAFHNEAKTEVASVTVKKGDRLDFVVDCKASENTDSFAWSPVLSPLPPPGGGKRSMWSAERDFGGPPAPSAAPLSHWERYCQALLLTNEFSYVD